MNINFRTFTALFAHWQKSEFEMSEASSSKKKSSLRKMLLPKKVIVKLNNKYFAEHLRSFLFVVLVILAGILLQLLVFLNKRYNVAKTNYQKTLKDYTYWSGVASQYPNIPDILYNAAVSAMTMGRKDVAITYLNKSIQIDPLFTKAITLRDLLMGNKK